MHQLTRSYGFRRTMFREAPTGLLAFLLAELFYKFHSFALECIAFLATWYVFSWILFHFQMDSNDARPVVLKPSTRILLEHYLQSLKRPAVPGGKTKRSSRAMRRQFHRWYRRRS